MSRPKPTKEELAELGKVTFEAIVTVKPPLFAQCLFLLSTALQWAVLINTNACYGCEELKSRSTKQVNQKKKLCELLA